MRQISKRTLWTVEQLYQYGPETSMFVSETWLQEEGPSWTGGYIHHSNYHVYISLLYPLGFGNQDIYHLETWFAPNNSRWASCQTRLFSSCPTPQCSWRKCVRRTAPGSSHVVSSPDKPSSSEITNYWWTSSANLRNISVTVLMISQSCLVTPSCSLRRKLPWNWRKSCFLCSVRSL